MMIINNTQSMFPSNLSLCNLDLLILLNEKRCISGIKYFIILLYNVQHISKFKIFSQINIFTWIYHLNL